MSVLLEFSIPGTGFKLGEVLSGPAKMRLELERIVPTGTMVMPFIWATGDDHETFERNVRDHPAIRELVALDRIDDSVLYRIEWVEVPVDLIEAIAEGDAVVLEARGDENWTFRLRFPNHQRLSEFHNYVIEQNIPIHIERTYTLRESTERGHRFGLTQDQREALVLALQQGYFESPSAVTLEELAGELDISRQAMSMRLRRGNEKILTEVLLSSAATFDE